MENEINTYIKNPNKSLKASDIDPDNRCELGQWIHGKGKAHESFEEYKKLKADHQAFHKCAADIVRKADSGENMTEELSLGSESEYAKLSSNIVGATRAMRRKVS